MSYRTENYEDDDVNDKPEQSYEHEHREHVKWARKYGEAMEQLERVEVQHGEERLKERDAARKMFQAADLRAGKAEGEVKRLRPFVEWLMEWDVSFKSDKPYCRGCGEGPIDGCLDGCMAHKAREMFR